MRRGRWAGRVGPCPLGQEPSRGAEQLLQQSEQTIERVSARVEEIHRRVRRTFERVQLTAGAARLPDRAAELQEAPVTRSGRPRFAPTSPGYGGPLPSNRSTDPG
jgi:hypothetical protein